MEEVQAELDELVEETNVVLRERPSLALTEEPPQHLSTTPIVGLETFKNSVILRLKPCDDSNADEVKVREGAVAKLLTRIYGLVTMKPFWSRGMVLLDFHTVAEAQYALRQTHIAIRLKEPWAEELILNCYLL